MSITNSAKPSTSITNASKVVNAELWSTITTTWASETRTWAEMISGWNNTAKPSTSITNTAKP